MTEEEKEKVLKESLEKANAHKIESFEPINDMFEPNVKPIQKNCFFNADEDVNDLLARFKCDKESMINDAIREYASKHIDEFE